MTIKYLFKDTFAVIGKAGQGSADNSQDWILPLWDDANAHFTEAADVILKNENGIPLIWGAMNDESESNKRWGDVGKYIAGGESFVDAQAPDGWTKWIIPAQTYMVVKCMMNEYSEAFEKVTSNSEIQIVGTIHEHYPEPGNSSIIELYFPIASDILVCHACSMPMTKPEDFGIEEDGNSSRDYCHHCYENGALRKDVTIDKLITDIQSLIEIEAAHPDLLSSPLLKSITEWLALDNDTKLAELTALCADLIDGQDCYYMGTPWEKEWIADGKVCHCTACVTARKCISDIKLKR